MKKLIIITVIAICSQPIFASPNALLTSAYLLYNQGEYQKALVNLDLALENPKGLANTKLSKAHFHRGQCLMKICAQKADPGEAHRGSCFLNAYDDFKKCLDLTESNFEKKEAQRSVENLRFYLMQEGLNYLNFNFVRKDKAQLNEALVRFNTCIKISEGDYSIFDYRGQTFLLLADTVLAAKDLKTGIEKFESSDLSINDAMAGYMYYRLASINRAKWPKQAVNTLAKGISQQERVIGMLKEEDPNNSISKAIKVLEDLKSMRLQVIIKNYPANEVLKELEVIVSASPNDVKPLLVYAELMALEDVEKAISLYNEATKLEPDNANIVYNMGAIYVNRAVEASKNMELDRKTRTALVQAEMQKALPFMETAFDLSPLDKKILTALVQISKTLGDEEKLAKYRQILETN